MTEPAAAAADAAAPTSVALQSLRRERAQTLLKVQHAVPAAALLFAGLQGLQRGVHGFELALAWAEIVFSALLLRTFALSVRKAFADRRRPAEQIEIGHHGAVDWSEILAGVVLLVEVAERWQSHGHLARPTLLLAAVTIGLGLLHGKVAERARRRRQLIVGADGVEVRGRFRRFSARWDEIERFEIGEREATLVARGGASRRLDFADLRHAESVRAVLRQAHDRWRAALAAAPASS
jgi:hypothetical protein